MNKKQVIEMVNKSAGSLFTKDDVINLINLVKTETKAQIDFDDLKDRIGCIFDDADDTDVELKIGDNNIIEVNTEPFKDGIFHDIRQLINSVELDATCQIED